MHDFRWFHLKCGSVLQAVMCITIPDSRAGGGCARDAEMTGSEQCETAAYLLNLNARYLMR